MKLRTICLGLLSLASCAEPPRAGVDEKFNLWPLAYYETTTDPEGHTLDVLWPLGANWRAGDAHGSRALPLWYDATDPDGIRTTDVLVLWWQRVSADGSAAERVLFPLFWWKRSPAADHTAVFPIYGHRTDHEKGGRTSGFALWPLATWKTGGSRIDDSFRLLDLLGIFTLFSRAHEVSDAPSDAAAASAPTAGGIDERDTRFASLFDDKLGLALARSTSTVDPATGETTEHAHFFPLAWHTRDANKTFSLAVPFYLSWSNPEGATRQFWVPPLFGREHDPETQLVGTDVLWPLIRSETWREGEADAWHFRFLPFAWFTRRPDSEVSLFLPFWYRLRDAANEYLHVVPLYGRHREDHDRKQVTFVVPPLFIRTTDKSGHLEKNEFVWPLSAFERSDDGSLSRVFPLWYWNQGKHAAHLNVLGLFDRQESEIATRWLLYPLYSSVNQEGVGHRSAVLPIFDVIRHGDDPDKDEDSSSVLWPLSSFERRGVATKRWVFPFVWWFDDGVNQSHRHVWPFFGLDEEGALSRWSTLWPFFWSGSTPDGTRGDRHVLWPLGASEWSEQKVAHRFFPLWLHERFPETGHSETWVLWPTTRVRHDEQGLAEWSFLWEVLRYQRTPQATEFHVLYALYRSREEGAKTTRSVPLLFSFENDGGAKTFKLFQFIPIRWGEKD